MLQQEKEISNGALSLLFVWAPTYTIYFHFSPRNHTSLNEPPAPSPLPHSCRFLLPTNAQVTNLIHTAGNLPPLSITSGTLIHPLHFPSVEATESFPPPYDLCSSVITTN
ncbi:hypothetical protein I3842_14G098200 [Carya illinoinensis]|uniref:Uncharacterized protein n=1 Tax=Carya illinoinensis TaxID=32201 RepID=A0A922ACH3_CARIL|nr:hypothetical protein I3842_14G098200 [Carya illinoinensis]